MTRIRYAYEADFCAVVVGEVEAFPVGRANKVVWSEDDRILDSPHVSERILPNRRLEYLYNGVCANLFAETLNRLSMIDGVDVKHFRV